MSDARIFTCIAESDVRPDVLAAALSALLGKENPHV